MLFLADENFPAVAVRALTTAGHDVTWIRLVDAGASDDEVLARARKEGRILLTFDKDFGELVFRRGQQATHGVVLFRLPPLSPEDLARQVVRVLNSRTDWMNTFTVVEPDRIRMRDLSRVVH